MEEELMSGLAGFSLGEVDEAIAAVSRIMPAASTNQKLQAAAVHLMKKRDQLSVLTRAHKFLIANADKFGADTRQSIAAGRAKIRDFDIYVRRKISNGSGIQPLLESSNVLQVGVCNVQGNRLEKGRNAAVTKVRIAFANHATQTDPTKVTYQNTDATTPSSFLNGDFVAKHEGVSIIEQPIAKGFNIGGSFAAVQGNLDVINLERPQLLLEDKELELSIRLPEGTALTNNNFVEIRLMGLEIRA